MYKKNAFAAKMCMLGLIVYGIIFVLIGSLVAYTIDPHEIPYVLPLGIMCVLLLAILLFYYIDFNSHVQITEQGITLTSKLSGTKKLYWSECNFIGIWGYNFGAGGILAFSKKHYSCQSQQECMRYAKKKPNLLIAYTPEVFSAVERHAPPHLVSRVKLLMR